MLSLGSAAAAAVLAALAAQAPAEEPADLTLGNFFSAGWSEEWMKRPREGRAPDMALLRVTTNFLERELRLDYAFSENVRNPKIRDAHFLNGLIAYGLNRRLMIEVISNYQWNLGPTGVPDADGAGAAGLVRLQLVDTLDASYDFQVRVSAPNKGIGQTQTAIGLSAGGFQDLQLLLGLDRVGLYYSIQYQTFVGPRNAGVRENDLTYAVALARTWTGPRTPVVGNLTTFLEMFGTTDLDGANSWNSIITLTPGIRFWFAHENSVTVGVDIPVTRPVSADYVLRLTYILNF